MRRVVRLMLSCFCLLLSELLGVFLLDMMFLLILILCCSPFDTGDRCFIDDENFVVKKMGLFAVCVLAL
jgi:hypothetical protein